MILRHLSDRLNVQNPIGLRPIAWLVALKLRLTLLSNETGLYRIIPVFKFLDCRSTFPGIAVSKWIPRNRLQLQLFINASSSCGAVAEQLI